MDDLLRRTLEYRGPNDRDLELALSGHLRDGRLFDAALAARALGRHDQAAKLFAQAEHYAECAACWHEAGDCRRAIEYACRVPQEHGLYRSCARLAVEAASTMGDMTKEVEAFITPWLDRGLKDTIDGITGVDLGDLYARLGRVKDARRMYVLVLEATNDETARDRLESLDNPLRTAHEPPRPAPISARPPPPILVGPGMLIAGRYRIGSPLGEGASAQVFRAADLMLEEEVAIKIFNGPFDVARRARFKREIHLARKLTHQNIVRIYELVAADGLHGITMEIVDGSPLDQWVSERKSSLPERTALLLQIARGLGYAHANGVVHRDIKPDNMFVTSTGQVKLMDFGIAKAYEQATITMSGALGGTPYYIAPEQILNFKEVDHRADLYALGVVAFELYTGALPFSGSTLLEILHKHTAEAPPRPRSKNPQLPAALDALVMDLLTKKPADRVQSADALIERLSQVKF